MAGKSQALIDAEERIKQLENDINEMADMDMTAVNGKVAGTGIHVYKAEDWINKCKEKGMPFGRKNGQKVECTIEELRALINSNWSPSMIMEKYGMNAEGFKQLVWRLSKRELRDNPIRFSIERDTISKEG